MRKETSSASFSKRPFIALGLISIALLISIAPASAENMTTYLAPQYENIPFKPETAFLSIAPAADPASPGGNQMLKLDIANEFEKLEASFPKAIKVSIFAGNGEAAKDVIPALVRSPEMLDSMKLRMIARKIKYDLIVRSGNASYAEFYKQYITAPLALLIGFNAGGPACFPESLYLTLQNGSYYFFNSFIAIDDVPAGQFMFSVEGAIKNDTFDLVIAHENAHGIMGDMYGSQAASLKNSSVSTSGHDGPVVTDRILAFVEGWAEAFEALYGPANPLLKLKEEDRKQYRVSEFLFTRQDPVRRDKYIWQTQEKNGMLKNGNQLISTEGVIAGQFYDLLTSKKLKEPFIKSVSVMFNRRPKDYIEFLKGWVKDYPEDKQTVYRIFLENTNYATASNKARSLYCDYYQAKLKYVQKQMDEKAFYVIKNKWLAFKDDLFKTIMRDDSFDANIGPDLWMNFAAENNFHLNLSTAPPRALAHFLKGVSPDDAAAIVKARESIGVFPYKTATEALVEILGAEKANKIIGESGLTNL